jgi:3-deoxy-manno-octulosonate cytidylyltransferase (CMP-KDO synthetase)
MKIICVIPSRIGSTRLAKKPLLLIKNKPMVQLVYENAANCKILNKVIVATDSEDIAQVIRNINGNVVMTDPLLPTGTDRVAAVAKNFSDVDVVINLQGDEPFVTSHMLEQLVAPYLNGENPCMTTLANKFNKEEDYNNPGIVKVITDINHDAIYFSRSPIPYFRENINNKSIPAYRHIGLYAFTRDFLLQYTKLTRTPLEQTELLEQLRAVEHGFKIRVCLTEHKTLEINTQEEYEQALISSK